MILSHVNEGTATRLTLQGSRGRVMHVICVCYMTNKQKSVAVDVCGQAATHVPQGLSVNLIKRVSSHIVKNISYKDS